MNSMLITVPIKIATDECKIYKDYKIQFFSVMKCSGKVVFENCRFVFSDDLKVTGIRLYRDSEIVFKDCVFECKKSERHAFIKSEDNKEKSKRIIFEGCIFDECNNFLYATATQIIFKSCKIKNCGNHFVRVRGKHREDNVVVEECKLDYFFECEDSDSVERLFVFAVRNVNINRCDFNSTNACKNLVCFSFSEVDSDISINNCSFKSAHDCLVFASKGTIHIDDCHFVDCTNPISNFAISNDFIVRNCNFDECTEVFTLYLNNGISAVANCNFYNCIRLFNVHHTNMEEYGNSYYGCNNIIEQRLNANRFVKLLKK